MTRVLIAVDGTTSDRIIVNSTHKLFGDDAEYVLINVRRDPMMIAATTIGVGMTAMVPAGRPAQRVRRRSGERLQSEADLATDTARAAAADADLDDAIIVGEIGLEPDAILSAADEYTVDVIVGRRPRPQLVLEDDLAVGQRGDHRSCRRARAGHPHPAPPLTATAD